MRGLVALGSQIQNSYKCVPVLNDEYTACTVGLREIFDPLIQVRTRVHDVAAAKVGTFVTA